jgi:asparagine synthase (glutamine-hydrolysing)
MLNPATGDWITYNGEIYNYPDLRIELEDAGAVFRSRCDTEAILHAYARWGGDCFEYHR